MVEIKVYNEIASEKDSVLMSMLGMESSVFSAGTVKNIFQQNPSEKEFRFNIHCQGGDVAEGLAIYDLIRNSGKTIHTNIDGSCHSMAITLLLAAPLENRTANPNCRALIHQVYAAPNDFLNADELHTLAEEVNKEQDAILDIYTERTGYDRDALEALMKEEKQRTASELLHYGFISKINTYSTNKKKQTMSKKRQEVLHAADSFLFKLGNLLKNGSGYFNYDFTDEEGTLLFSTEGDDDALQIGMEAIIPESEDNTGTFTLPDGRTVIITKGKITEVGEADEKDEEIEKLQNRVHKMEMALQEANNIISTLKNQVHSTYTVKNRLNNPGKKSKSNKASATERINETKEKLNKAKAGK